jgi:hypothetical protein
MAVITELNSAPYFDDYSPQKINPISGLPEIDKDFLRILFRPGYAVQAREMNQLQSILQNQVERFGKHIFKEGSIIFGGLSTIDTQTAKYLTIEDTFNTVPISVIGTEGSVIVGSTSGARGIIVAAITNDNTEPKTLIYKPLNGISFVASENLVINGNPSFTIRSANFTGNDSVSYSAFGDSSTVSIDEGMFFTKGIFVVCPKQTVALDKYSKTPNKIAGLLSEISIVTEDADESLLDNANGSFNFAAPGAHRLKINLSLTSKEPSYTSDIDTFIQILEVREGKLYKQVSRPTYNELAKLLARRTFDESGDYTVKPFILNLENYPEGATGAILANISPGKAYVKGFEVETISTQNIDINKARTTESYNNSDLAVTYSNYVIVNSVAGVPETLGKLYLFDDLTNSSTNIGFCYIKDVELQSSAPSFSYKLYLFDITITNPNKSFSDVLALGSGTTWTNTGGSTNNKQFIILTGATGANFIYEPDSRPMVFDTGYGAVSVISDVNFTYSRNYNSQTLSNGSLTIQTPTATERFVGNAGSTLSPSLRDLHYIVTVNDSANNFYGPVRNYSVSLDTPGPTSVQTATINTSISFNAVSAVDDTDDEVDVTNHGFSTGTTVIYSDGGGSAIGLTSGNTYYIIRVNADSFGLASSFANAISGTKLTISPGTGTQSFFISGQINIVANINNNLGSNNTKTLRSNEFTEGYFVNAVTSQNNIVIPQYASDVNDFYKDGLLKIVSGPNASETTYTITAYNGTTKTITLNNPITATVLDYFSISPYFVASTSYVSSNRGIVYAKSTTLSSSISSSTTTSISVSSGSIPNASVIRIGSEEMYVSGGGGTVSLTVIRGYRGTTATTHSSSDPVSIISIGLIISDVIRVNKVITSTTSEPQMSDWFNPSKDITKNWLLDNGQRDNYYDISSITLKSGVSPYNTGIVVFFDYFQHIINDGFFSTNSYADRSKPSYYKTSTGKVIDLHNAIDLRPTKDTPTSFVSTKIPNADSNFGYDISYFLPRIDKVAVTTDGVFEVIEGIPSINPRSPKNTDNALSLYELYIPPYTYTSEAIKSKYIENKRYTMRDIGKLEKRIENLEYYTSLNALEKNTALFNVRDVDGLERFKNGIIADPFIGHNIGDPRNPDYACAIDVENKNLRSEFRQKAYSLSLVEGSSSNYTRRGNLITKSFTDSLYIDQPLASRSVNVNPFSVFAWNGELTLTPDNDFWKDTRAVPSNVTNVDGLLDNITDGTNPFGTLFNQWNSMWFGTETTITGWEQVEIPEQTFSWWQTTSVTNTSGSNTVAITQESSSGESSTTIININDESQTRALTQEEVFFTIPATTESFAITETNTVPVPPPINLTTLTTGDLVTSVALSEYIRPRRITFSATGLKPNTRVYPFFDRTSVTAFVTPTGGSLGGILTTDSAGNISGTFDIPFGRFFVGDRNFLLSDSSTGTRAQETTSAEARYTAQGLEETTTQLSIPIALPDPNSPFWTQNDQPPRPVDPLAQTFFVDPVIYPEGVFISKVDLFFRTKDANIPLTVQIRETVNGYPSSVTILSSVTLPASSINISEDSTVVTVATFSNVVYLGPGEYSIVLLSNSNDYEAWVSQIGERQVGTNRLISEQPYVGSLFKSQNASTWTAEQTEDLAFRLYRCEFNTSSVGTLVFTDWDENALDNVVNVRTSRASIGATGFNSFSDVNPTTDTINIPFHPYSTGSSVSYSGSTGFIGINNGTYFVNRVDSDTIKLYNTQENAIEGGNTGLQDLTADSNPGSIHNLSGGARIIYVPRVFVDSLLPGSSISGTGISGGSTITNSNILENTITLSSDITQNISAGSTLVVKRKSEGSGKSDVIMIPAGFFNPFSSASVETSFRSEVSGNLEANWTRIPVNKNYEYNTQRNINISGESFRKRILLSNSSPLVSPVINATRQSVIQIENIINNDLTGETEVSGGFAWNRYITRTIKLLADSAYFKSYMTINKPSGTEVKLYYKIKSSSDSNIIDSTKWIEAQQLSPSTATFSPSPNEFLEYTFVPKDSDTSLIDGIRRITYVNSGITYSDFVEIKFKIVCVSSNTSIIPRVADFRAVVVE